MNNPHKKNAKLNEHECAQGKTILESYPTYIAMNLIGTCNARCQFCYYSENCVDHSTIGLPEIKRMPWLKNVSVIDLYGGVGEPLMLPDFPDIVDYLKEQNPTQDLHVTTNGQLLVPEISDRLAGKLSLINISINAATKGTYERIMQNCSWNKLIGNLERFQEINKSKDKPTTLTFSYAANTENVRELPLLSNIASVLEVKAVGVSHFSTGGVWMDRKAPRLPRDASLYYHKEFSDTNMQAARESFGVLGVPLGTPPLFSESSAVCLGSRIACKCEPDDLRNALCFAPWKTAYINPDPGGKWVSCCCCVNVAHMDITPFRIEDTDFMETWNSELFQLMRRDVNQQPDTPLANCDYCRWADKVNPLSNISQLEMMVEATKQYHLTLGVEISQRTQVEIYGYQAAADKIRGMDAEI